MKKVFCLLLISVLLYSLLPATFSYGENVPLVGKLVTDKREYSSNEYVSFLFTITNTSNEPITLKFKTSQIYDFEIMKDGQLVFKWGIGRMFAPIETNVMITGHGTKAFSVIWSLVDMQGNKVGVGTYSAKFYLANNYNCVATVTFTIENPMLIKVFPDVTDYYISKYLKGLVEQNIVKGYPDGTFGGDKNLTRAEATVLIMRVLGIQPKKYNTSSFSDVTLTYWAHDYIEEGVKRNIIQGVSSGKFAPGKTITRGEFVTILMKSLGFVDSSAISPFIDVPYTYFGYREIATAFNLDIIQGSVQDNNLKFAPNDFITRNSTILILARAIDVKKQR